MKKTHFYLVLILLIQHISYSQSLWLPTIQKKINAEQIRPRIAYPKTFQLYALDLQQLNEKLQNAPLDIENTSTGTIIPFPDGKGKVSNFYVKEVNLMEAGLQAQFPSLKSYAATCIENPTTTLRISITDFGLHAMSVTNKEGTYFIDSYTNDNLNYIVYYKKECSPPKRFSCLTKTPSIENRIRAKNTQSPQSNDGLFRQYRLAITTDAEFSQFHIDAAGVTNGTIAQKKSAVLSALLVTLTRINGVYERDFGVRMNLVANNDLLISLNTDNFTDDNILDQNIDFINLNIGFSNYDIGHIFTLYGGSFAAYASICTTGKAAGTTGSSNPVGDPFDIDYVAHEIGHQFGANHTFNNSCDDNVALDRSVEPGSGSTIMSYAGICDPNIQNNSDAYFSTTSIEEVMLTLNSPDDCSITSSSTYPTPTITPLLDYTIPHSTAFVLTGNASAQNPSLLTYSWEQIDTEMSVQPPLPTSVNGPNFRSLLPVYSLKRYMPNFESVLNGNLTPTWEVTSSVARTFNFAFTIRDNALIGAQTQIDSMKVFVANNPGVFSITYPNVQNLELAPGSNQNITWNVAGTTTNGINTAFVNLLLSTDGGQTFSPLLVNTPNDGNQWVILPNTTSPYCRIMVEAVDNIYYAVSKSFSMGYTITNDCTSYSDNLPIPIISDENLGYTTRTISVPNSGIVQDVNVFTNITHDYFQDIKIDISSPTNPTSFVTLYNRECGNLNGTLNLKFTDSGTNLNCVSSTALQSITPFESLNTFNGQNAQGNWTLRVYDHFAPDEGIVNNWSVEICTETATLTTTIPSRINFTLYPNPNNGIFKIQYEPISNDPILIDFYDVQGRKVMSKKFNSRELLDQVINAQQLASGLYIITLTNGIYKVNSKMIVD
jgi:subtilisin-like proprotein convertase family protein